MADRNPLRDLAIAAAAFHIFLCVGAGLVTTFLVTFPWENRPPEAAAADDALIVAAVLGVIVAFALAGAVIAKSLAVIVITLLLQLAVFAVGVGIWLIHVRSTSAHVTVLYALAILAPAAVAATATHADQD